MIIWKVSICSVAVVCFISFAWAVKKHFLLTDSDKMPSQMRVLSALAFVFMVLQLITIVDTSDAGVWATSFGLILYSTSLVVFWWAVATTKDRLTLAFSTDGPQYLITIGPYRYIRHPFYTSYILFWLAGAIVTSEWLLVPPVVIMTFLYFRAARMEEGKFACSDLNMHYKGYRERTGMFVPRIFKRSPRTQLRIATASTDFERRQLILLRTRVYRQSGKHTSPRTMRDDFDGRALIVGVWKDNRPIATARVLALDPSDEWEHDRFIDWVYPLPDRRQTAEISRFCVDYRERSWITIKALCSGITQAIMDTRRRYFVACCTDELVPFYKTFFGAEFTGGSIVHSDLGTKEHHMFVCDYQLGMVGVNIDFFGWLSLWPKLASAGLRNGNLLPWIPNWRRRLFLLKCRVGGLAEPLASSIAARLRRRNTNRRRGHK